VIEDPHPDQPAEEQPNEPSGPAPGGPIYAELIRDALAEERARKDSLERRGVAMVSASAFLSAFVLALLNFSFDNISALPRLERGAVWFAICGFVLAAGLGLVVNWPRGISEPKLKYLETINDKSRWNNSPSLAAYRSGQSRLLTIDAYRKTNGRKAGFLTAALAAETIAIVALAVLILALIT